jgi:hypothetical protein
MVFGKNPLDLLEVAQADVGVVMIAEDDLLVRLCWTSARTVALRESQRRIDYFARVAVCPRIELVMDNRRQVPESWLDPVNVVTGTLLRDHSTPPEEFLQGSFETSFF